mmetsp:Transcript_11459/g.12880  ORF Transcript_11459/g.12880 Transcript_11459/m.12880 type:complete len:229 (+) Transcript_11459:124-810(+)
MGLRRGSRRAAVFLTAGAFAWAMTRAHPGMTKSQVARQTWPCMFVPAPQSSARITPCRGNHGCLRSMVGAAVGMSVNGLPARAEEMNAPDVFKFIGKLFDFAAKGSTENNDPTTEEGARAMGLAFPLPKDEELPQATLQDAVPFIVVFTVAVLWGLFAVPAMMERADGSKTVYFPEKEEEEPEPEGYEKINTLAPVVTTKRFAVKDDAPVPKRPAPKKKATGFNRKKR